MYPAPEGFAHIYVCVCYRTEVDVNQTKHNEMRYFVSAPFAYLEKENNTLPDLSGLHLNVALCYFRPTFFMQVLCNATILPSKLWLVVS